MNGLQTDLYQLTMAAGFFETGKVCERATFELFVRHLPRHREFLVSAGLAQAVDYLLNLSFTSEQVDYIRKLPQFERVSPGFFEYLRAFRFTGDVFAMREGTPFFPGEPILTVRAPLVEAQIPETYLLAMLSFQSMIATKAVRVARAADGRSVVEFGTRRAHSPEAGVLAGRAAYIGGCIGTSNLEAGFRYGIPVFGTAAHSWVMSFPRERAAQEALQKLLGARAAYLIDTYDTVEGARMVASLGKPLWGVRLDSGDLVKLSREVRKILDAAGLPEAKIMASGDLNEEKVRMIVQADAPIDVFGVGTELATSADSPNVAAVYKMSEMEIDGIKRYTFKHSVEKETLPGAKQVFRHAGRDQIACEWECPPILAGGRPAIALLRPVILDGELVESLPDAASAREHCVSSMDSITPGHIVEYSAELRQLAERAADDVMKIRP
jgi:nicotinate phosphoribosyltransferase